MGPGKKNLKATKKFEKNHLKGVLDKRKAVAKIKQRQQVKDKKQARRAKDAEFFKGTDDGSTPDKRSNGAKGKQSGEMSIDDFFRGGFEEIIDSKESKAGKLGKRKRSKPKEDEEEMSDGSGSGVDIGGPPAASESEDGSEDDDEGGMSKETMDKLAEKDPEFYKFLKDNDPEALDFDDDADLAEVDELSAGEDEDEDEQPKKKKQKKAKAAAAEQDQEDKEPSQSNELTQSTVASWRKAMEEKNSLRAARQVVLAFRCAAHLNEDENDEGETQQRWAINSPEVYNDILVLALKQIPVVMNHHLPIKESASGRPYVQMETKKFKTLSLLLKSYTSSIMYLLGTLSDDKTLKLTLSSLTPILPYLLSFKKLVKALSKAVVNFWAQPASSETTRITAFLVLRRLVVIGDKGIRETVLKATYQGLVQGSRVTNHNTIEGINLMKNSAAELWGIDPTVGYTTAFTFIRQLAIHLRNSIVNNKNDSFRMVYNWQFTHSLDFWSCVLAEHCSPLKEAEAGKESQLKLLIYPLVQVTLGAMRLIPTAIYFPLRFHLVRSLLRTSRATGTYIPLASPILEVLSSAEMKKAPKATTLKAFDFAVAYKAPKSYLRTRIYQDNVGEQIVELLGEFFLLWSTSIAFPELALPVIIQLKRWLKQARSKSQGNKNAKLVSQLVTLVQKLEANAKFIEERRAKVDFAPKDRAQVDAFSRDFDVAKTPLGAYVVNQRKAREEKNRMLEEARKEEERKRREDEKGAAEYESNEEMEVDDEDGIDEEEDDDEVELEGDDEDSE
ncbi:Nucleolar Complex 2 protein [Metarhizium acridum]|uniref:Ribosome assembly protein Noc2, putative n=1 Tax=Metarhizium acridum (strain CQMa 102) TaxID=655827 RepID=E9E6M6_METAQ|nr:ribosome assembly protein Noc2, putative [Metarhizium acridum CQMa 102]EFY88472.1 ribosome assembly protein Noc2, putative [Metarhizium acridum CQMa 102]KAG8425591.1 Nucleolar Complex 2 protein [Metarhizium acridum]